MQQLFNSFFHYPNFTSLYRDNGYNIVGRTGNDTGKVSHWVAPVGCCAHASQTRGAGVS
jgi:hypothetical protein